MTAPDVDGFVEASLRDTARELFAGGRHVDVPELLELGWEELIAAEPRAAVTALMEAQGRSLGRSRLLELVLGRGLDLDLDPGAAALAIPLGAVRPVAGVDAIVLGGSAGTALVVVYGDGAGEWQLVRGAADVTLEVIEGIDPGLGWVRVRSGVAATGAELLDPAVWDRAVGDASRALAHEMVGLGSAMLELAVDHVRERQQFGVPIGSFQAVQHRLADVLVDLEATRAVLRTAWTGGGSMVGRAALASARRAVQTATANCHQVLGAMGCTWEHPLHLYIRRGIALGLLIDPAVDLDAGAVELASSTHPVEVLA